MSFLDVLGKSCSDNEFCEQIKFSQCSENKTCSCTPNTIKVNSNLCVPILNGFCWHDNECFPDNSICIDNKCQCITGFTSESNDKCAPTVPLWQQCNTSQQCNDLTNHSMCSSTIKLCVCQDNYYSLGNRCIPLLNGSCSDTDICTIHNSECIDGKCQCKPKFLFNDLECKPTLLNERCVTDQDCTLLKYSKCSAENECICDNNYIKLNETSCGSLLEGLCSTDEQCTVANSTCTDNKCQCRSNFLPKANNSQCEELLNQYCLTSEHCKSENSICIDTKCRYLGMDCLLYSDCIGILHANCSKLNVCSCQENYYDYESVCVPLLEGYCDNSTECFVSNSICIKHRCQCKLDFKSFDNDECQPLKLHGSCNINKDCDQIENTVCIDNECTCNKNYMKSYNGTCKPLLGGLCSKNDECMPHHSICVDNVCKCRLDHVQQSNEKCLPLYLKQSCEFTEECCKIKYSVCLNNKCVCKTNYTAWGDSECKAPIGEYCDRDKECLSPDSTCNENKCQCRENFISQFGKYCKPASLLHSCYEDADCADLLHTECSLDIKKCVCKPNNISLNKLTCFPLIGGYCTADYQCMADHTVCIDNYCQCKPNSCNPKSPLPCCSLHDSCRQLETAGSFLCTLKVQLGDLCRIDDNCKEIRHSKCSKDRNCVCRSNNIQVNATTCAPLLGEFCWQNEQCATDNAVCIDMECQCTTNYIRRSNNQCLQMILGKICRSDEDCNSVKFAECSEHKICKCDLNTVEINPLTCAPLLNGVCFNDNECFVNNSISFLSSLSCHRDKDCSDLINYSECPDNRKCACKNNYTAITDVKCASYVLNEHCYDHSDCVVGNSTCVDNKCQCKKNFLSLSNDQCIIPFLSTLSCDNDTHCSNIVNDTECADNNKCVCKKNYIAVSDVQCAPTTLNQHCNDYSECVEGNSTCIDNKCRHTNNYGSSNKTKREYKICVCSRNNLALSELICTPIVGEFCTNDTQCLFHSSYCIDFTCQCRPNLTPISATQCVTTLSLYSCNEDLECSDPWHAKCSEDKLCVCNSNNTALSHSTCLPQLNGYCWKDDQCVVENSICFDFNCQCKPNFVLAAKNLCVPYSQPVV
ncbi:prion-like-(Q/N-rich) domain-bearing protein 25 [Microplitis mediator]|uniref:prion-like-(Q/N-rich) domain-bearing protein 25 n=1 Tax=Microplitis mediator TaxID=375433 RepID=UPI002554621E|nr:prion-like-(Q/N-rich) domain-bearing protein 25 [Microplitis mediator]